MHRLPSVDEHVKTFCSALCELPRVCLIPAFPQEPRHLQLLADLEDSSIFSLITGKKQYSAPTDFGFCIKVLHLKPCLEATTPLAMRWKLGNS